MGDLPLGSRLHYRVHLKMPHSLPTLRGNVTGTGFFSPKHSRLSTQYCPRFSLPGMDELIKITHCPLLKPDSTADRRSIRYSARSAWRPETQQIRAGGTIIEYQPMPNSVRPTPTPVYTYIHIYTKTPFSAPRGRPTGQESASLGPQTLKATS